MSRNQKKAMTAGFKRLFNSKQGKKVFPRAMKDELQFEAFLPFVSLQADDKTDKSSWSPVRGLNRLQARQLPAPAVQALFKAKVDTLPAYAGADLGGGYAIYKIVKVERPEKVDGAQLKSLQEQFAGIVGPEDMAAYLTALRLRHKVEVNRALVVETRER